MTRVLVIDDDRSVRNLMSKMLTILGCWVETATDGLDAVDRFRSHPEAIDLVVTDLQMPVMDGHEAVRQIRKVQPNVKVVCMSAADAAACPPGASFLSKPFTLAEVQDCVGRALAENHYSPAIH